MEGRARAEVQGLAGEGVCAQVRSTHPGSEMLARRLCRAEGTGEREEALQQDWPREDSGANFAFSFFVFPIFNLFSENTIDYFENSKKSQQNIPFHSCSKPAISPLFRYLCSETGSTLQKAFFP